MILTKRPDDTAALSRMPYSGPPLDGAELIDQRLIDAGVPPDRLADVRRIVKDGGFYYGGEYVRHLLRRLNGTPAGEALQAAILGPDESLTAIAAKVNTSKQALSVSVKRIQRRIKHPVDGMGT